MKHVRQAGLEGAQVTGRYHPYSKVANAECVVIAVRYIDDKLNRSKTYTEYDLRDIRTGQIYNAARHVMSTAGMDDGTDDVLRPAQKLVGSASAVFDPKSDQLSQSDGDRVLVTFSYGAQHSPVILGVIPHQRTTYGTTREHGFRRFATHRGTSVETKSNGTYVLKRENVALALDADDGKLKLGDEQASDPVALKSDLDAYKSGLSSDIATKTAQIAENLEQIAILTPGLPVTAAAIAALEAENVVLTTEIGVLTVVYNALPPGWPFCAEKVVAK